MTKNSDLIRIYSGTELNAFMLKDLLEANDIVAMIRNDFHSGNLSGFFGGTPTAIDVYVLSTDAEKALPLVDAFIQFNEA